MENLGKLNGKVALITGASKGIGAGIAKAYANQGATVIVNYASSKYDADKVVEEIIANGGKAIAIQGNVEKSADVKRIFEEIVKSFGKLDILVNNAGIYKFAGIDDITEESFHNMFNINVLGSVLTIQQAVKLFGDKGGVIINTGSIVSTLDMPTTLIYTQTKYAVDAMTRILAKELGPKNIRINSINPGLIETEGSHSSGVMNGDAEKWHVSETPLGRVGKPEDIAKVAVFLASEDSNWITGETIAVSGGQR
ncbi:3-oxoacyl-[acyl-carrier protein] reductase [Flavobacterium sp. 90]|uniref:SDR family NAD(P)-dependent oxidoreductase n=1 Tax=unclassified Flavobacterium TaxID=196869 RepID=UPI000EAF3630|nr:MULTISPECIES: glucose 1-dehydrogenase [unclassified Flavobacterium]RKR11507.1 3-oxoacyl-[acyl-carrier protein] reductase [Flavobacterium sp. 81]TCK55289.1 3-oxoacyl-[acyl-carrier protein] reductase [Flavobacterium sp. 90]